MPRPKLGGRARPAVGAIVLFALLSTLVFRLWLSGVHVETDINSILPAEGADPVAVDAIRAAASVSAARVFVAVHGPDESTTATAAESLETALTGTGLFIPASTDVRRTAEWIAANRYELACERPPMTFSAAEARAQLQSARAMVYSGAVPVTGAMLRDDPFLLQIRLWECLAPLDPAAVAPTTVLITGRLSGSAFRLDVQDRVTRAIEDWRLRQPVAKVLVERTGAVFFAAAAASRARTEIALVGGIGMVLLILLYWVTFRAATTAAIAVATVAAGTLGGASVVFVIWDAANFTVLVFGSALTGVAADYAVHTLAARRAGSPVVRPLTISMLSSAAGFGALLLFEVEVFRQIGAFAIGGLATAWLFAMTLLPRLDRDTAAVERPPRYLVGCVRFLSGALGANRGRTMATVAVGGLAVFGLFSYRAVDDIRQFQPVDPALKSQQESIAAIVGPLSSRRFVLSQGVSLEAAQGAEEDALSVLGGADGEIFAYTRLNPSPDRREAVRTAYREALFDPHWSDYRKALGLEGLDHPMARTQSRELRPPDWLSAMYHRSGEIHFLIAPLADSASPAGRAGRDAPNRNARVVDPPSVFGDVLAGYRKTASLALLAALGLSALVLVGVYRRLTALAMIVPPAFGIVVALAVPGLLGVPTTAFSTMALFVVLGTSIDFSVFQWESRGDRPDWAMSAILVAALTTICSMGLLSLSETLPMRSFGATVAAGLGGSVILSYMLASRRGSEAGS